MPSSSTKRIISIFLSMAFLVAALVIYTNLVRPEYESVQKLRGTLLAKTELFASQKAIISQVKNLLAQFKGAAQLQETISLALPTSEATAAIFQQIQAISKASGLTIQNFGVNLLPFKEKKLGAVQINIKLFGNYAAIKAFLKAAETNVRVMDLTNLKIEQGGKPNQDLYSYTVALNSYYQQ